MNMGTDKLLASVRQGLEQAFPPVTAQLLRELVKPHPDFDDIAQVIGLDPVMSAAVLTLVNSPFYALSQKVTTLERAAVVLGTKEILKIALSVSFVGKNVSDRRDELNFANWRLVVWSAIAAELIAEHLCPEETDQAYLCTLLKDLSLLLVERTAPDMLPYGHDEEILTCLRADQLAAEQDAWGMDHPQLTIAALAEWGVPDLGCGCIAEHHDMHGIDAHSPLTQAVILGTQWSELTGGCDRDPILLVQFEMMLRDRLEMTSSEVEDLRAICIQKYRSMLSILDMEEAAPATRLYEHPVQAMQNYHFQTMEITSATGGSVTVGRIIGRHLRWNFGLTEWDLALRSPLDDAWELLQLSQQEGLVEAAQDESIGALPWRFEKKRHLLLASGEIWGELRLKPGSVPKESQQDLALFVRFFSRAYEQYCMRMAVLESKARTLDALPVGVGRLDSEGRIKELNQALASLLGDPEEPLGRDVMDCMALIDVTSVDTEWRLFLGNSDKLSFSKIHCFAPRCDEDEHRCMYFSAHKETRAGRQSILFMAEDVSEVSSLEMQALKQGEFMEQLVESMQELVLTVEADGTIVYASPSHSERLTGRNLFRVAKPVGSYAGSWNPGLLETAPAPVEAILQVSGGDFVSMELNITRLRGSKAGSPSYLVVGRDLTSIRRLEERLKRQAVYDSLTDLFNRYQFHAFLHREARRSTRSGNPMGMIFFDLDDFKAVNDKHGHQAGDKVLKGVAAIIRDKVRKGTDFPCRYGGDEFAIIATDIGDGGLEALGGRIREAVQEKYGKLIGVSMGIARLKEGELPEDLLRRADRASYEAKSEGGNRIVEAK